MAGYDLEGFHDRPVEDRQALVQDLRLNDRAHVTDGVERLFGAVRGQQTSVGMDDIAWGRYDNVPSRIHAEDGGTAVQSAAVVVSAAKQALWKAENQGVPLERAVQDPNFTTAVATVVAESTHQELGLLLGDSDLIENPGAAWRVVENPDGNPDLMRPCRAAAEIMVEGYRQDPSNWQRPTQPQPPQLFVDGPWKPFL